MSRLFFVVGLLCLAAFACGRPEDKGGVARLDSGTAPGSPDGRRARVEGDLLVSVGDPQVLIAPPDSATAGSEWLECTVTFTNTSGHALWIDGYSADHPFYGIDTRCPGDPRWSQYELGFCGTGAGTHPIAAGESQVFKVALPANFEGHEFRVTLPYGHSSADSFRNEAQSNPREFRRAAAN